jgi:hypothetical protein
MSTLAMTHFGLYLPLLFYLSLLIPNSNINKNKGLRGIRGGIRVELGENLIPIIKTITYPIYVPAPISSYFF